MVSESEIERRVSFEGHGGIEIAASAAGPADGLPVCLLHGGGQTRYAWRRALDVLADRGFRALSLDLRGHGESGWSPAGDYRLCHYVADLRAVVATLGRPPLLVGASLGGIVSVLAAGERSAAPICGLVLVDVAARMDVAGVKVIRDFMFETLDGFGTIEEAAAAVSRYLPHRKRPADHAGLKKNLRLASNGRLVWHWDPRAFDAVFDRAELDARLEAVAAGIFVPAILLRGSESELVSKPVAEAFMARFPDGRFVDLAGAGHMVAGDLNDQFNEQLLAFAEQVRRLA